MNLEEQENEENNENIENNNMENENDNEENNLMYIYEWVDSIPLSRQKKNISRDFNDAVLLAEMIKYHYPRLVDLHNYPSSSSTKAKIVNWETLNKKVLKKLGIKISKDEIKNLVDSKPNAIENLLERLYHVIHGMPQEIKNTKNNESNMQNLKNKRNENINNMENRELVNAINEKDQEISNLKEYIESLKQQINASNERQAQLELKIKELNNLLLKSN